MTQFAQPGYPPQAPAPQYPPQYGQPPQPQQFQQPAPQYAPPPMAGYPPVQMAPPPPALAQGSLDDFFNQPSAGGGAALKFEQIGTRYIGIVSRPLGPGDVQQQTDTQQRPQFFKDGRPKFVMKVLLQMQPSQAYPDGIAQWYVKGAARDELVRAMSEAGAPPGPPEAGAVIDVTHTSTRQAGPGMSPAKLFTVSYRRPDGAAPAAPQAAPAQPEPQAQPQPQPPAQQQQFAAPPQVPAQPQFVPPQAPQQPMAQAAPQVPQQPQAPAAAAPAPPAELTQAQQQLLAQLGG